LEKLFHDEPKVTIPFPPTRASTRIIPSPLRVVHIQPPDFRQPLRLFTSPGLTAAQPCCCLLN